MIRINGLNKFFNKGRSNELHVINNVELELPEKGMVAIFGKSGCGKTTLLNVIGGLDSFENGLLTIEGADIRKNTDDLRNKYIGYIFQNYNLNKEESCYDNIADALRLCGMQDGEEMEERVNAALSNVGMDKYGKRTPDTLSGGQQQRIAIARAIVKNPRIILADEPTGNLDEANTLMIMDLLKQISKDHLVLLVTHEADLVDYYCDTVIELQDGKVINTRSNESASGYTARDKNDIYLGELEKDEMGDTNAKIEYYGNAPAQPIKLKIVNYGGKTYLKVETEGVQILDSYSEVKLKEGTYTQTERINEISRGIDMSKLPPIEGTKYGKLFNVRSSIKSGYAANFSKKKRGITLLKACMIMFAVVLVFMSSAFGTSIYTLLDANSSYSHNTFYVYTPGGEISAKLNGAVGAEGSGIDYVVLHRGNSALDKTVRFMTGNFETFSQYTAESIESNAVFLSTALTADYELVAGKREDLKDEEILISTALADRLLEKSTLGYISDYGDLIGLITNSFSISGKTARVAGVVRSSESALYLSDIAMAKYVNSSSNLQINLESECGYEVEPGKAIFFFCYENYDAEGNPIKYPSVGETIMINGRPIEIVKVMRRYTDYYSWINGNNITLPEFSEYMAENHPEIDLKDGQRDYEQEYLCEYIVYRYSYLDQFISDYYSFNSNDLYLWMAVKKNIDVVKYLYADEEYRGTVEYKKEFGVYPTYEEMYSYMKQLPDLYETVDEIRIRYEDEFYNSTDYYNGSPLGSNTYIVDETDYIAFSHQKGETDPTALPVYYYYEKGMIATDTAYSYVDSEIYYDVEMLDGTMYTLVHSSDPTLTAKWLETEIGEIETPYPYIQPIVTPDAIFDTIVSTYIQNIIGELIAMGVVLAILSVCMYFIMRSSLMNRIKEIGIYRAIGVSKKNLVLKFLIEAAVLTLFTVFVGYLIASIFINACLNASPLVESMLYYPFWLAITDLVIIAGLCIVCGILPIAQLLRKTPSAILAKYDI